MDGTHGGPPHSAGILVYRYGENGIELLLGHSGHPAYAHLDPGAWTVPKGKPERGETLFAAALREFHEETGHHASGVFHPLDRIQQDNGKRVSIWAVEQDLDITGAHSASKREEWPPGSGEHIDFPELDRLEWVAPEDAIKKVVPGQDGAIMQLMRHLGAGER